VTATAPIQTEVAQVISCVSVYRLRPSWRLLDRDARRAGLEAASEEVAVAESRGLRLRGAYSMTGLRADADLMLWCLTEDVDHLRSLAVALRRTQLGAHLETREVMLGLAGGSEYKPEHKPAFARDEPPRRYLAAYPFIKQPEWYLLPFERRRELMAEHGRVGREHNVAGSTVRSFGLGDSEFVVAMESDRLEDLVDCVDALRRVGVREYTQQDMPVYLGRLQSLEAALGDLA
jgi:peroxiredoxin